MSLASTFRHINLFRQCVFLPQWFYKILLWKEHCPCLLSGRSCVIKCSERPIILPLNIYARHQCYIFDSFKRTAAFCIKLFLKMSLLVSWWKCLIVFIFIYIYITRRRHLVATHISFYETRNCSDVSLNEKEGGS